ncbi:MAG TPA: pseudouridine synthase [Flavobacteriaceae bacterium]|nr:pseudouridine synthase [Flavobacteriaceae bacterium]
MNKDNTIRINKAISSSGYCSRRQADTLIENERVTINGKLAVLGDRVTEEDTIAIDGKPIREENQDIYLILNKPVGITCTTDTRVLGNVIDFINYPKRIFHVGRLDKPSEGLLLLTNDGDIVNKILRAEYEHEKEYIVRVDRPITSSFIQKMSSGVPILDTVTKRCEVEQVSRYTFKIILKQGLNRQIRRMCEHFNYNVEALQRVRLMHIELGDLPIGEWRYLTKEELKELHKKVGIL